MYQDQITEPSKRTEQESRNLWNLKSSLNVSSFSEQELSQLLTHKTQDLFWLSGYCYALATTKNLGGVKSTDLGIKADQSKTTIIDNLSTINDQSSFLQTKVDVESQTKVLVIYASQTGNAEKLAKTWFSRLKEQKTTVDLASIASFKPKKIKDYDLLFFVISTHGEGEPPEDAIEFFDFIQSKRAPDLSHTHHSILGLGDSSYEFYCQAAKNLEEHLLRLGSKQLANRCDLDLDYEKQAEKWYQASRLALVDFYKSRGGKSKENLSNERDFGLNGTSTSTTSNDAQSNKTKLYSAVVEKNIKITGSGSSKTVHHIELSVEDDAFKYQPGDSVGIRHKNDRQLVASICELIGANESTFVTIDGEQRNLFELLQNEFEVTLLSKQVLQQLFEHLLDSSGMNDEQSYTAWLNDFKDKVLDGFGELSKSNQLIDVLMMLPKPVSPQFLVSILKPKKNRLYSIASSQDEFEGEVHLCVGDKRIQNSRGQRFGSASHFLIEHCRDGESVELFVEENRHFKLPPDDVPIIMIGAGTGIAPFRSFVQSRALSEVKTKNWLFYGDRNFNTDFLYQTEWLEFLKKDSFLNIDVAFSRDQGEKIYVQDRLKENGSEIWNWLINKQASIFVCGDRKTMATSVNDALLNIVSEHGQLSLDESKEFLKQLSLSKRYQKDVY